MKTDCKIKQFVHLLAVLPLLLAAASPAQAERYALLVGIGDYQSARPLLQGPRYDVAALRQTLIENWGFPSGNVVALVDQNATRERILRELAALEDRTASGDHVFIYLSGHGTSAKDPETSLPLPHTSGAFLAVEFPYRASPQEQMQNLIIGRRDLRPLLIRLDSGGRQVFVAVDSCYSGNAVRGLFRSVLARPKLPSRYVSLRGGGVMDDPDLCGLRCGSRTEEPYPYRNVVFLAAASESEAASDIGRDDLPVFPTLDGQPHGAFSDALLRVLNGGLKADSNGDGLSYGEIYHRVKSFMADRAYNHVPLMLPQRREDANDLASRRVFENARRLDAEPKPEAPRHTLRVQLVERNGELEQALTGVNGIEPVAGEPDLAISREGSDTLLINGAGDLIVRMRDPDIPSVVERIQREVWLRGLIKATPGNGGFNFNLDLTDNSRGITVVEGERFTLSIQAERAVHLLLIDVNANGEIAVLYPYRRHELDALPAGKLVQIPGPTDPIQVTQPFGIDQLVAYGFPQQPALLAELQQLQGRLLTPGAELMGKLQKLLTDGKTSYAQATFKLISVPHPDRNR